MDDLVILIHLLHHEPPSLDVLLKSTPTVNLLLHLNQKLLVSTSGNFCTELLVRIKPNFWLKDLSLT